MDKSNVDVTAEDIDNILDEIEQNEEKTSTLNQKSNDNKNGANWKQILTQLQNGNSNFVKSLITSKDIAINEQDPINGKTLLIYVTIIGNYDLVKLVCNFGASVHIRDHSDLDALDYSKRYGRYAITELLFYRQLSGTLGNDLKEIATAIYDKNEEAKILKGNDTEGYDNGEYSMRIYDNIIKAMIKAIEKRDPFSPDLLYYAWYFYLIKCKEKKQDPLRTEEPECGDEEEDTGYYRSRDEEYEAKIRRREKRDAQLLTLWRVMMISYEAILKNTSDKKGWEWLKKYFINSLIWYLPHPKNNKSDDAHDSNDIDNDMEYILQQTLFYELLIRVRKESKIQSDLLLKSKIDKIKSEEPQQWNTLISYHINTKFNHCSRQDVCGCIEPKYSKDDLNETLYPPSTHFSAQKHYDTNIYLNELLFRANIMDTLFQFDMKKITNEINLETGFDAAFRAGPVKTITRSQSKVENDYIEADYPTAAKILDLNRCAIQFKSINEMMKYIQIFTERVGNKGAFSIIDIIRCKNGWSVYNSQAPAYTDIKLNVLVQSPNGTIVAEVQLLLSLMSSFKKKAHKLYSVERKFEMIYNFNKLQRKMSHFKDIYGHENLMIDLIQRNEFESFKTYWLTITNEENLTNSINALVPSGPIKKGKMDNPWKVPLFYLIMDQTVNDIYNFLERGYSHVLCKALETYLNKYHDIGYQTFLKQMKRQYDLKKEVTADELVFRFMERVFHFTTGDSQSQTLAKLFTISDKSNASFVSSIGAMGTVSYENQWCPRSFKYIIENQVINADDKLRIFGPNTATLLSALKHKFLNHIWEILFYFHSRKDKERLLDILRYTPKKDSAKTGFLYICSNTTDKRSLLPFILNNSRLNKDEKYKLISLRDETIFTAIEQSLKGSALNTQLILNYVNDIDIIMSWISEDLGEEMLNSESVFIFLKHINNDKEKLMHLLGTVGLFVKLMNNNRIKVMEYILYHSCLTPNDIIALISNKCIFDYPSDKIREKTGKNCCTEIIRYFKRDKQLLLKILEMVYDKRSLFKMLYAKYESNEARQILFKDSALTPNIMYEFLKRNEKGVGVGDHDHDFGPKKETTFFKLVQGYHGYHNTLDLMNYLPTKCVVDLLLQQHTKDKIPYIAKLEREKTLQCIYSKLNDNTALSKLLSEKNAEFPAQRQIASQYEEYLKFCDAYSVKQTADTEIDENMFEDIDIKDNPLRTAFICGNHEIIQSFLNGYLWKDDGKKLFKILNKPQLMNKLFCNENENEISIKILRMLILENEHLSEQQKFDIINTVTPIDDGNRDKHDIIITPPFISTNNALRLEVLNYFEKQGLKKYVLRLLQQKVARRNNREIQYISPLRAICKERGNGIPPVEFIINSPLLMDNEKVKLFDDSFVDIVKLNKGLSLNILKFIQDNRKILMHFLSKTNDKTSETVLMLMMKMKASSANESESLMYILNNELLSYKYKCKLIFEDMYVFPEDEANSSTYWGFGPYQYVFALSCKYYHNTKYIEKIFEYFDVEKDGNFEQNDDILVKIETAHHLKVVLKNINDNKLMRKLFSTKSKDKNIYGKTVYEACLEYAPSSSFNEDIEPKVNRNLHKFELIHKYQDYLKLNALLNEEKKINIAFDEYTEYWSNPWITCCEFGKMETIIKLINYVVQIDDDKYTKLKSLLRNNYDLLNGNDWIMTLFDNGFKQMIIAILQRMQNVVKDNFEDVIMSVLIKKNNVTDKTFLMMICDNENNKSLVMSILSMVKGKAIIRNVLNCKDDTGNICLDYAEENIKKVMQKYYK